MIIVNLKYNAMLIVIVSNRCPFRLNPAGFYLTRRVLSLSLSLRVLHALRNLLPS